MSSYGEMRTGELTFSLPDELERRLRVDSGIPGYTRIATIT